MNTFRLSAVFSTFLFFLSLLSCDTGNDAAEQVAFKRTGNDVIVRLEAEPDRLNPVLTTSSYASEIIAHIFSFLLVPDLESYEMLPNLAKSRPEIEEITSGPYEGGLSLTFEILEEAVWDDGKPVTAQDFLFMMKATMNPKVSSPVFKHYFRTIRDVTVDPDNEKKFTIFTDSKYIIIEAAIGNNVPVLPAHHFDPQGLLKDIPIADLLNPERAAKLAETDSRLQEFADTFSASEFTHQPSGVVGCGPYRLENWDAGNEIVLVRKADWWGDQLADKYPHLRMGPEKIVYKIIPNAATALAALKAEDIDVMNNIEPKDFVEIQQSALIQDVFNLSNAVDLACYFMYVNNENPKLADKRVRQALAHAIDVDEILAQLYNNLGQRTTAPMLPNSTSYNQNLKPIQYNIDKAKSLLTEAGWEDSNNNGVVDKEIDGELVEMNLTYLISAGREITRNAAVMIQKFAEPAGFNIEPESQEFTILLGNVRNGDYELAAGGTTVQYVPWEPRPRFHSEGGSNYANFYNPEANSLIDEIQVTMDRSKRDQMYHKLQEIIYDEQPVIFYLEPMSRIAIHKRFEAQISSIRPGYFIGNFMLKDKDMLSLKE